MIKVVVSTCDKYLWALRPFAYLFNTYWSAKQIVIVAGYSPPSFDLPDNFQFVSINPRTYPAKRWSDGMIEFFSDHFTDDLLIWMLEDYWLTRAVDTLGVRVLGEYTRQRPGVLRFDLTTDRMYNGMRFDVETFGHYDIVETPAGSPYQMSLQAGIWHRSHLLRVLVPGKTPWQTEIETSPPDNMRVLGSRQWPVRYLNAFKGQDPTDPLHLGNLVDEHRQAVISMIPDVIRKKRGI